MTTSNTNSPQQTIECGSNLGRTLKPGTIIALTGQLGSGKTTFVKGLALGLGVKSDREVKSPTFVIMHIYHGRLPLYHFDLYRLDESQDLQEIGFEDYLCDPNAVSVVEWAERVPDIYEQAHIKIEIKRVSETEREIIIND